MQDEPTVFIVDPEEATRVALHELASTMNLDCRGFSSGRDFLGEYSPTWAGCAVLEVKIPDVTGFEIQEHLTTLKPGLPVVFLTSHATVSIAVRAMRAGAVHFLEKPFRETEMWDTIQEAIHVDRNRRHTWLRRRQLDERLERLSSKEQRMLRLIAAGKSKHAMATELKICVRTAEVYRVKLMRKLQVGSLAELVHFALTAYDGHALTGDGAVCELASTVSNPR